MGLEDESTNLLLRSLNLCSAKDPSAGSTSRGGTTGTGTGDRHSPEHLPKAQGE